MHTTSYRYLRDLKKFPLQLFWAENPDVHIYKKFLRTSLYNTDSNNIVKVRIGSPKNWLGMNKFVRTKSPTGSKFSKIFFQQLYTGWTVVVYLYCGFLCSVRWRHNRAPNLI